MYGHYWGMHMFWWIFLFIALMLLLAVPWMARMRAPGSSPQDILRRRYAAGELSEEEYRHRLDVLGSSGAARPPAPAA